MMEHPLNEDEVRALADDDLMEFARYYWWEHHVIGYIHGSHDEHLYQIAKDELAKRYYANRSDEDWVPGWRDGEDTNTVSKTDGYET